MVKFSKYVEVGEPVTIASGIAKGVAKAAEKHDKVLAILEDMSIPGLEWFVKNAPDRIIECGVAEGNAAVVAAGLAAEGFIPFIYSNIFAAISRAYNPIRQSILPDRFNVKIMARGGAWGVSGISHNDVEGIAATRVLPNLVIVNPADITEAEKSVMAIADYIGPVFLKIEASFSPPPLKIFTKDYPFEIGKAHVVKEGGDATLIATGYMLTEAIKASEILEKEGVDVGIINMSTIKPLDEDAVIKAAEETGAIVTAENNSIIGGLGESIAAVLAENIPTPLVRVGVDDEFSQSGRIIEEFENIQTPLVRVGVDEFSQSGRITLDELKVHFKLDAADVASAVKECIAKKYRTVHTRKN